MRITKGKLKQIIAEEHALVYGTKRRRKPTGRRRMTKQKRMNEAKRELVNEIQTRALVNELMAEGFFGSMFRNMKAALSTASDVAGEAGAAAAKKVADTGKGIASKAADMKAQAGEYIDGLKKAGNEKIADISEKFSKAVIEQLKQQIADLTKDYVDECKSAGQDEDEARANLAAILTPAVMQTVAECYHGPKKQRLLEAKSKKKLLSQKRRNRRLR